MIEVVRGVWRGGTRWVNWYVVDSGSDGLVVVDAGLPSYRSQVVRELAGIGRSVGDVRGVLLTHGHADHVGAAAAFAAEGAEVFLHPDDDVLAADPRSNRTDKPLLPYLRWPATLGFVAHALANGILRQPDVPAHTSLADSLVVPVPGSPVVTHVPGHTAGSCVFEFPEHGVLFAGDLLCTVNPVSGRPAGPQIQSRGSNLDSDQTLASLQRIEDLSPRVVLPGHGNPWTDGIPAAIASARTRGCR